MPAFKACFIVSARSGGKAEKEGEEEREGGRERERERTYIKANSDFSTYMVCTFTTNFSLKNQSKPKYLPKASFLNAPTLGVGGLTYEFEVGA